MSNLVEKLRAKVEALTEEKKEIIKKLQGMQAEYNSMTAKISKIDGALGTLNEMIRAEEPVEPTSEPVVK
jgi:predicted nuclease with TOPRIM domain